MFSLRTWALIVTALHLAVVVCHAAAHQSLQVDLTPEQLTFVVSVIIVGPLLSAALLMFRYDGVGSLMLSLTMLGSLIFGIYFHFVAESADNVSYLSEMHSSGWAAAFEITAYILGVLEAIGTVFGALIYFGRPSK